MMEHDVIVNVDIYGFGYSKVLVYVEMIHILCTISPVDGKYVNLVSHPNMFLTLLGLRLRCVSVCESWIDFLNLIG